MKRILRIASVGAALLLLATACEVDQFSAPPPRDSAWTTTTMSADHSVSTGVERFVGPDTEDVEAGNSINSDAPAKVAVAGAEVGEVSEAETVDEESSFELLHRRTRKHRRRWFVPIRPWRNDHGNSNVTAPSVTTVPPTTTAPPSSTTPPTTSTPPRTTTPPTTTGPPSSTTVPSTSGGSYINNLATFADFTDRIDFGVQYRDPYVVTETSWEGDHALLGHAADGSPICGGPTTGRALTRDGMAEHVYWCDVGTGHMMTSQGDTTGYGWVWFKPSETFTDVTEVRWDVNVTNLGNRQFTEMMIIPSENWLVDSAPDSLFDGGATPSLPCLQDVFAFPCLDFTDGLAHGSKAASFGAVSTSTAFTDMIFTDLDGNEVSRSGLPSSDPGRSSVMIRRTHVLTDNRDGTVTFGIEREDGTFLEHTYAGEFPSGEVMIVFKDHNYTPDKSEWPFNGVDHTWHWDSIAVEYAGEPNG